MTKADLFRKWAWVHDVCKGTPMEGRERECVKLCGFILKERDPDFGADPKEYEFMLGLLEGRPLFDGDEVWSISVEAYIRLNNTTRLWNPKNINKLLSWEAPEPEGFEGFEGFEDSPIYVEGVEMPKPLTVGRAVYHDIAQGTYVSKIVLTFTEADAKAAAIATRELVEKISSGS